MSVINLAVETTSVLSHDGYTVNDIAWIGTREFTIPVHEFFDVARNTVYSNGYGSAAIPCDLIIMMNDGSWYSRGEYDGSEWWEHNIVPEKPIIHHHLKVKEFLEVDYYWDPTLAEACGIRR
jgi:hypothetical protein